MSRHHSIPPPSEVAKSQHEAPVVGGLYLDEAGEHPPDYGEPLNYDERRWGVPHRDSTSGGMPTMSVCRVLALHLLASRERTAGDVIAAIATELSLADAVVAQQTQSGENRLDIRVRWALATLLRMGFVEILEPDQQRKQRGQRTQRSARVPRRTDSPEIYGVTEKGKAMLAKDPVRIDESGTGSIRREKHRRHPAR